MDFRNYYYELWLRVVQIDILIKPSFNVCIKIYKRDYK
jgi:hypothetical protein